MTRSADDDASVEEEQGFLSHLIELRDRMLRMVIAITLAFIVLFFFREPLYTAFADPLMRHLGEGRGSMQAIDPAGSFFAPLKLVLMLSVFATVPYLLYQVWAFVAPGLYRHEKRLVFPLIASSTVLFYIGVAFCWFVVFPLVFGFFARVAPEGVEVNTDVSRYLDFAITMFLAFGVAFEVPVATVLLVMAGVTTPENLVKMRPYIFVGAFVIGMFLTPPDIISQTLLALPMWLLFEIGVVFSRQFRKRVDDAFDGDQADTALESADGGSVADANTRAQLTAEKRDEN